MSIEIVSIVPFDVITQEFAQQLLEATHVVYPISKNLHTTIVITDDQTLHDINKKYRKKDSTTDVLSFRYDETTAEILLSVSRIQAQAKEYGFSEKEEAGFLIIHGLLHNEGWDHERSEKEAQEMRELEIKILSLCNLRCARS